ncbi:hypothetical protein [Mycolicibacterium aubagnense]|uniref:Uncharacterized protein n=1 Tax=Mycolicibacterium aubagnense TaxID=319707 RepID=A0ABN5YRX0_9MYCO|nr:hypothetical protein [Mycolicibacterium aubagnense]BBX83730.1 hypothetical protein MAUB_16030 [Mycolicibacterium aubagnense]
MTDQPPYLVRIGLIQEDAGKLLFYILPEDGWTHRTVASIKVVYESDLISGTGVS